MIRATILIATFGLPVLLQAQRTRALEQLAYTMAGSYTSAEQAKADSSYFEIELEMVRIWPKRRDGAWFYVEQATASNKEKPYRQRVYQLREVNDSTFVSRIFTIKGGAAFHGGYKDAMKLAPLSPDSLQALEGCDITLERRGIVYVGSTVEGRCPSTREGATFTTSEVTLHADRMISWDRGWDTKGTQVWGATKGGYIFLKQQR